MLSKLKYRWHRSRNKQPAKKSRFRRSRVFLKWSLRLFVLFLVADGFYLANIWPDWNSFKYGTVQKSNFIKNYQRKHTAADALKWKPVKLQDIPHRLRHAVIVAEDARFYSHHGFDILAFRDAMKTNLEKGRFKYGASTISQQTVKNMFFSAAKNPLRKWHELIFTLGMEMNLSKDRVIETYLNVAEFGKGLYGVEAATRYYWGIPVKQISVAQAIELAATLPSPVKHNPATRTQRFLRRVNKISEYVY